MGMDFTRRIVIARIECVAVSMHMVVMLLKRSERTNHSMYVSRIDGLIPDRWYKYNQI